MKGYLSQLWNDPSFFANTTRALLSFAGSGVGLFLANPVGRTITERAIFATIGALGVGVSAMPSAKKD